MSSASRCARRRARGRSGSTRPARIDLGSRGEVCDEGGDRVKARPVPEYVHVVERKHERDRHHRQRGRQARDHHGFDPGSRTRESFEHSRRNWLDSVQCRRDVRQENHGVVVAFVERHPREGPLFSIGPLGDERRLAVSRPGKHRHNRRFSRTGQAADEPHSRNGGPSGNRTPQLRFQELESRSSRGPARAPQPLSCPFGLVDAHDEPHLASPASSANRHRRATRSDASCPELPARFCYERNNCRSGRHRSTADQRQSCRSGDAASAAHPETACRARSGRSVMSILGGERNFGKVRDLGCPPRALGGARTGGTP